MWAFGWWKEKRNLLWKENSALWAWSVLGTTPVPLGRQVEVCYFLLGPLKFFLCSLPLLGTISLQLLKRSPWIPLCSYSHDPQCFGLDFSPVFSTTRRVVRKFSSVGGFRFLLKTFATCNTSQKPLKNKPSIRIIQSNGIKSTDYALETTYKEGFYRSVRTLARRGPWYEWKRLFQSSFILRPGCFLDSETFFSSLHLEKWGSSCERVPLNAQVRNLLSGLLSQHSSHANGGFLIPPSALGCRITHPFLSPPLVSTHKTMATSRV